MAVLRFLHVFGTFDHGGAEARTLELMRAFDTAATHTILVADQAALGARDGVPPGVVAMFPAENSHLVSGRPTPARLRRLAALMTGFDVVLTYSWGAMDVVLAHRLFGRFMHLPRLIHHEDGLDPPQHAVGRWLRRVYRRLALPGAEQVVVPSRSLAVLARKEWRVPSTALRYIPNGVALEDVASAALARDLRHAPGDILVMAVAGLRAEKNLPRLIRAAANAGANIRVAILGEGPERAAIAAEAARAGISDRLNLAGFVRDARTCLHQADIFALSSDTEQCPLSLIEAMAAGLPVVATNVGDIEAMVSVANRPFIVACDDEAQFAASIRELAANSDLRRAIGRANAEHAGLEHSSSRMIDAYFQLYFEAKRSQSAAE